jgi:Glycosyl transferases group 1/Glycosyl transferase 4-like domain
MEGFSSLVLPGGVDVPRQLSRVLTLGLYPIARPIHGGQRRLERIVATYRSLGLDCLYLAVYPPFAAQSEPRRSTEFRSKFKRIGWLDPTSAVYDVHSGIVASEDPRCRRWLRRHFQRFNPTHVHIEQPFMWPAFELLKRTEDPHLELIYSSQNVEGRLKRTILERTGHQPRYIDKVVEYIEELERRAVASARLVICASRDEQEYYEELGAAETVVCRNGASAIIADRTPSVRSAVEPYLLCVGSGYPPNLDGFAALLLEPALFFLPPRLALVVAGGMADGVALHPAFKEYEAANRRRVELRPDISDNALDDLKAHAHGFFLPITHGGGTNLKTAEAILSGKWVVATSVAMRGFSEFEGAQGILVEDERRAFRDRLRDVLARPRLELDSATREARRGVEWENSLAPLRNWILSNR